MRLHYQADLLVSNGTYKGLTARARVTLDMSAQTHRTGTGTVLLSGRVLKVSHVIRGLLSGQVSWDNERVEVSNWRTMFEISKNGKEAIGAAHASGSWTALRVSAKFSGRGPLGVPVEIEGEVHAMLVSVVESSDPATPPQPAGTPGRWPWLLLPATCGWFADRADLPTTIDVVSKIATGNSCTGRLGLDFEGTGDMGNPGADVGVLLDSIEERFRYLAATVVPACIRAGLPAKITAGNTNDFGKGFKRAWKDTSAHRARYIAAHRDLAAALKPYSAWLICQALAEQDISMPADFRKAVQQAWREAGFPTARMAADDREGGAALNEQHIKAVVERASTGSTDFVSTDNGGGIAAHFSGGDTWTAAAPTVNACAKSARAHLSRGTSFSLYHRATRLAIVEHLAAYGQIVAEVADLLATGAAPADPTAFTLANVKTQANGYITWDCSAEVDRWAKGSDNCIGWLVLNGVKCEQFRSGYRRQHLRNAYNRDEHGVRGIRTGAPVTLKLQGKVDAKLETNVVTFTWPWKGT